MKPPAPGTGCCFPPIFGKSRSRSGSFRLVSNSSLESSSSRSSSGRERSSSWSRGRRDSSRHQQQHQKAPMVVCFGEMMVNLVPTESGVSLADAVEYKKSPAGSTANVAIAISRLGASSAFIGKVGNDEFGYMLSDILMQNGVDNSGLLFDEYARTMLAFYALKSDGEPQFLFYRHPSADMLIRPEELDVRLIKKATIFHYSSFSLVMEPSKSSHLAAMNLAKMCGCLLSYAPNLTLPIWPSAHAAREGILNIWNFADIIKDYKGWVRGFEVEVVDTDGADDAFLAGLLSILSARKYIYKDERKLREALAFANASAAVTMTRREAIPSLPTKDAVIRLLLPF
ncbi:probable fructokinase-6, chloroplastic isoform X2 [Arachis duranensis]|uniref:Probable fructokinase-6, chloroplastic isoform X2 n=1 Tax=Arachis duranensis TaxID=130453 RepID=A0A9C6TUY8_ARADU|nr:probable fructokinase-6, chloroplastic isoform X2 [Arachis duranensis]